MAHPIESLGQFSVVALLFADIVVTAIVYRIGPQYDEDEEEINLVWDGVAFYQSENFNRL